MGWVVLPSTVSDAFGSIVTVLAESIFLTIMTRLTLSAAAGRKIETFPVPEVARTTVFPSVTVRFASELWTTIHSSFSVDPETVIDDLRHGYGFLVWTRMRLCKAHPGPEVINLLVNDVDRIRVVDGPV